MPSEVLNRRRLPSSHYPLQKQVGFWGTELLPDNLGPEKIPLESGKTILPPAKGKLCSIDTSSGLNIEPCQPHHVFKDSNSKTFSEHFNEIDEKYASPTNHGWGPRYNSFGQSASLKNKIDLNVFPSENSIFSSSLPGTVDKRFTNGTLFNQSTGNTYSNLEADEPVAHQKEIENTNINDLLPDDDELFSGVTDDIELEYFAQADNNDDVEDDLFYSGGGIELEVNGASRQLDMNGSFFGGQLRHECPSRTLIVRNISTGVDDADLRFIFKQYGDIRTLNITLKDHGVVMVSYYDLRSACDAILALQNKLLMQRKLDIQFLPPKGNPSEDLDQGILVVSNLDSSLSNEYLCKIFHKYGEIKEIWGNPQKCQKIIEFYDVRAIEAAFHNMNRSIIAGKEIHLEPYYGSMQQVPPELLTEQTGVCLKQGNSPNSSHSILHGKIPFGAITSKGFDNGSSQGQLPIKMPVQNTFNMIPLNTPSYSSSPVKIASVGSHYSKPRDDLSHSMNQIFGFHCLPNFQTHSLPEYHDGLANVIPNTWEGVHNRHIPGSDLVGLKSQGFVHKEHAFGASSGGNFLLQGQRHEYLLNNSPSNQCPSPGHLVWPNSVAHKNSIPNHPHPHGLPRAPPKVLNTVSPFHNHHVGSAPTGHPSLWDNHHHTYKKDFTETTALHPVSLVNTGFSSSSTVHQLEFGSPEIFPHGGGSSVSSPHVGFPSHHRNYNRFHGGRTPMIIPAAFETTVDRVKGRKIDPCSNQVDHKKQYELDIERIINGKDNRTTLMIKNIPNKYTSKMLLATIDEHHRGTYDFIYLPIDFKNKCNVGYAFINLTDPKQIIPFHKAFNGKRWEKFNSEKVASLAYARIQGKAALVSHFQNSSLMNEDKRCRPILFHSDGPNAGDQEPFPVGVNIRSRSGRSQVNEENHQVSPSNSGSGDESSNGSNSTSSSADSS